ncbi:Unknown protein sequence [Pseudomonas syringae pv. syringae]|nr:Unknown protein sequence [Pseudomonas syringae pv. syringae]
MLMFTTIVPTRSVGTIAKQSNALPAATAAKALFNRNGTDDA